MATSLWGATLTYDGTAIGKVTSVSSLAYTRSSIDCTGHDATHRSYISTIPGGGEVSFTVICSDNTDPAAIYADMVSGDTSSGANLSVVLNDTADQAELSFSATAIPLGFNVDASTDDASTVTITFQITGAPTISQ
tara:strand:+ start:1336 stop:1743 length:408 start_codon:yes stop_codon:yes gene_type:complete